MAAPTVEVVELYIYPVKSCKGIRIDRMGVGVYGFHYDRFWLIIDADLKFVTQRSKPTLCFVEPQIDEEKGTLTLKAPNMEDLVLPLKPRVNSDAKIHQVTVWDDQMQGIDQGDEVAEWICRFLGGAGYRLVAKGIEPRRLKAAKLPEKVQFAFEPQTGFADAWPFLLVSTASLDDLNSRLEKPAEMKNFRPNIVVKGCEAFEEDKWKEIAINGKSHYVVTLCIRCQVTTVDTEKGEYLLNTYKTLQKYRRVHPTKRYDCCPPQTVYRERRNL